MSDSPIQKAKKGRFVFKRPSQTPQTIEDEFAMDDSFDEILTQEPHEIAVQDPNEITIVKEPTSKPRTSTDLSGPENKENLPHASFPNNSWSVAEKALYVAHYEQRLAEKRNNLVELALKLQFQN